MSKFKSRHLSRLGVLLFVTILLHSGCSSGPSIREESQDGGTRPPAFSPLGPNDPGFVVRERSLPESPAWLKNFPKFRKDFEKGGEAYVFLGESGDVVDRIAGCELALLEARKQISERIANLISTRSVNARNGSVSTDGLTESGSPSQYFESRIASKSLAFLSGVETEEQYWEERDYSVRGGKPRVYRCAVVAKLERNQMQELIRKAAKRLSQKSEDRQLRESAQEGLKNLEKEWSDEGQATHAAPAPAGA